MYDLSGIGFNEDTVVFRTDDVVAMVVSESRLLTMEGMRVSAPGSDGNVRITGRTIERVFTGKPMLLQIDATLQCDDADKAPLHRPALEGRTSEVVGLLSWALPNVVLEKLRDSLYTRLPDDARDTWEWFDATRFSTSDYYDRPALLAERCDALDRRLSDLHAEQRGRILAALRWWRHASELDSPVDEVVALWTSIESIGAFSSDAETARQRALDVLLRVYPELAAEDSGRRVKRLRDVLYSARCAAVHGGQRDLANSASVVALAHDAAKACISFAVDEETAPTPPEILLATLGV